MKRYDSLRSGRRNRVLDRQRKKEKADIRNSRSFGYGYAVLTGVAVFVILILAFALFFKVDQIRVYGAGLYSEEEIIAASGFKQGDNLYLFNKYGRIQYMFSGLPYLDQVRIRRKLPDTIIIEVEETTARFAADTEKAVFLISPEGKIVEEAGEGYGYEGVSRVYGLKMEKAKVGLRLSDLHESGVTALENLVDAMKKEGVLEKLGDVDLTEDYDLQFIYEDRFLVRAGMPENLERKVIYLEEVIRKLGVTDTGSIELSGEQLRFVPTDATPELNPAGRNIEIDPESGAPDSGRTTETESESVTGSETGTEAEPETETEGEMSETGTGEDGDGEGEPDGTPPEEETESGENEPSDP